MNRTIIILYSCVVAMSGFGADWTHEIIDAYFQRAVQLHAVIVTTFVDKIQTV